MENCKVDNNADNLFTGVTGNRVSDHYARIVYIKVFLEIAVPWMLMPSEILYQNVIKFVQKYLQQVPCRSVARNFTRSLIF